MVEVQVNRIRFEPGSEGFHTDLRTRVDAYFEERDLSRHANPGVVIKIALFIAVVVGLYAGLLAELIPGVFAIVLGVAMPGFVLTSSTVTLCSHLQRSRLRASTRAAKVRASLQKAGCSTVHRLAARRVLKLVKNAR